MEVDSVLQIFLKGTDNMLPYPDICIISTIVKWKRWKGKKEED